MKFPPRMILPLIYVSLSCLSAFGTKDDERCDLRLADHILNTPRTFTSEETAPQYRHMSRWRFQENVQRFRAASSTTRKGRGPKREEHIVHLCVRPMGIDELPTRSNLVITFIEQQIYYDRATGKVGRGASKGQVHRTIDVRFRFDLQELADLQPYHLRSLHDHVIPIIQAELDLINEAATQKFGRTLLSPLSQAYPGEYEATLAPKLRATELAFLIGQIADR